MKTAITIFLVTLGLVSAFLASRVWIFLYCPPQSPGHEVTIVIPPGTHFEAIIHQLEEDGVVADGRAFRLLGTISGKVRKIRAGEFRLSTAMAPLAVLQELTRGRSILHRLQVREGLPWWEVGHIVEEAGLGSFASFEAAVHNPEILQKYGIPGPSAEGYLFPETYFLPRSPNNNATCVVESMLRMFRKKAEEVWPEGLPPAKMLHNKVILASLVEKETAVPEERARIAGVYTNRLQKGIRLQCDPTIIYGLGLQFDGNLTKKHLRDKSNEYNTYTHAGLPPGPICSPGKEALAAAKTPEKNKFIYFVAKKDGTHYFSHTLEEHNRAVRKYQLRH